jgi:hypothetical protein
MTRFLAGLELVEPGLVTVPEWRPEAGARRPAQVIPLYGVGGQEAVNRQGAAAFSRTVRITATASCRPA